MNDAGASMQRGVYLEPSPHALTRQTPWREPNNQANGFVEEERLAPDQNLEPHKAACPLRTHSGLDSSTFRTPRPRHLKLTGGFWPKVLDISAQSWVRLWVMGAHSFK